MPSPARITSARNERLKALIALRQRRQREQLGRLLIEGYRSLLRAVEADLPIEELYIARELFLGSNEEALISRVAARGGSIIEVAPEIFAKACYRDRPEGLLAVAPYPQRPLTSLRLPENPLLVVAQAIEKPGNLGTIIRAADAAGAAALLLCDRCTDLYNPNVITASTGLVFSLPVCECSSEAALDFLRSRGIIPVAALPQATEIFTEADLSGPLALVVGAEQYGLDAQWRQESIHAVRIPMLGRADSLNVAQATTLLLYEARRQRQLRNSP